jgi:hypothetical protein
MGRGIELVGPKYLCARGEKQGQTALSTRRRDFQRLGGNFLRLGTE